MTITINYEQKAKPGWGYTPRKPLTLHNVEKVIDAGPRMVKIAMTFSDRVEIQDHVVSVLIKPETEN